ncbi:MAG: type II toxin-antitoxin system Phd/YefM family antitoxin [Actinopolymorphaceae bacterium]
MTAQHEHEITQRDLRHRSGQIMDAVEHGEAFIVTRNGAPIGELIPLRRRRTVTREQFVALSAHAPIVDAERFRADLDSIADPELRDPYAR